jgi:hypothetical protein
VRLIREYLATQQVFIAAHGRPHRDWDRAPRKGHYRRTRPIYRLSGRRKVTLAEVRARIAAES